MKTQMQMWIGACATIAICCGSVCALASGDQWATHRDASGFEVELPQGWEAEGAKDGHVLIRSADKSVFAVLQPFKSPNGGSSAEWIKPLVAHMSGLFPGAALARTKTISTQPDEAIAKVTFNARGKSCQANVLCYIADGAGMFFGIGAPADQFAAKKPELMRALRSFHYEAAAPADSGSHKARSAGPISYVRWKEPNEGAFTTDVPQGWKVTGGIYRYAPVDVRPQIDMGSPGGGTHLQIGDANTSAYVPPGPSSQVRGLHEGQQYVVNGVPYTVMHFIEGAQYSRIYVQNKIAKQHPGLEIGETKDRPDAAEKFSRKDSAGGAQVHDSVGETEFTYTDGRNTVHGCCLVKTQTLGPGAGAVWLASPSILTTTGSLDVPRDVLNRFIDHLSTEPAWDTKNQQISQAFSRLVLQNHERAMAEMKSIYEKFTHQMAENQRQWSNVLNNETDVRNPETGQTFKVAAGNNYYFQKGSSVVGNNTGNAPDINVSPLQQY